MPFNIARRKFLKLTGAFLTSSYLPGICSSAGAAVVSASGYRLYVSTSSTRSQPLPLNDSTVTGKIFVFVSPDTGIDRVRFYLDASTGSANALTVDSLSIKADATTVLISDDNAQADSESIPTGSPYQTELSAPYDLAGTRSNGRARPFDTIQLANGNHTVVAVIDLGGGTEIVSATFTVANGGTAAAELIFSPSSLALSAAQGTISTVQSSTLGSSDGTSASHALSSSASWLKYSSHGAATPTQIDVWADTANLAPGTYTGTVAASAAGYSTQSLTVTLQVAGTSIPHQLMVSTSAYRSAPGQLSGSTVTGKIYVFAGPESGVSMVRFFIDNPSASGSPYQTEFKAPYDLAGTRSDGRARPFDTTQLTNGTHTIVAVVDLADGGTEMVNASFQVRN